jgi:hypothetical protein
MARPPLLSQEGSTLAPHESPETFYRIGKLSACPDEEKNRSEPDEVWSVDPLKRMNCVVYPLPSAKWGKNCSALEAAALHCTGRVDRHSASLIVSGTGETSLSAAEGAAQVSYAARKLGYG